MSLNKYVHQLKPIQENKNHILNRVQNLVETDTGFATLMEKSIVVGYNMKMGMSEEDAVEKGGIKPTDWEKDKKTLGNKGIEDGKAIAEKLSVGQYMVQTGRLSGKNYYKVKFGYTADDTTSKTDVMGDSPDYTFSMKQGGGSFLATPGAGEAAGMVRSALLNYEVNEEAKANQKLNEFVNFLAEDFNKLRYSGIIIEASGAKKDFQSWYLTDSKRRSELSKIERNKKKQDDHMKAELSVFKIPSSMSNYKRKLIPNVKPLTKDELDKVYFPAYVGDNYQIGSNKEMSAKDKAKGKTVYGQINPKYFTGNDKEVIKDNTALKKQIVRILETTIEQKEAHNKWKNIFQSDESFKRYLVYEAASGCFKFTGQSQKGNYTGSTIQVAKKLMSFKGTDVTIENDLFEWAGKNTDKVSEVSMDIKGASRGRYTALKFDYNPEEQNIYSALDRIMEEEWYHLEQLNEGLISFLKRKWRNAKDAIAGFIVAAKKAYKKYIESVIIRVIDAVKKAADKGIKFFLEFMDLEINASVSFGKM